MDNTTINVILAIVSVFTTILLFVFGLLYSGERKRVSNIEEEQLKIWEDLHELRKENHDFKVEVLKSLAQITSNYLSRFDSIKDLITKNHEEQIQSFTKLFAKVEQQSIFCHYVQNNKEK